MEQTIDEVRQQLMDIQEVNAKWNSVTENIAKMIANGTYDMETGLQKITRVNDLRRHYLSQCVE